MDIHTRIKQVKLQMATALKVVDKEIVVTKARLDELQAERAFLVSIDQPAKQLKRTNGTPDTVKKLAKLPSSFTLQQAKKALGSPIAIAQLSRRGLIKKTDEGYQKVA